MARIRSLYSCFLVFSMGLHGLRGQETGIGTTAPGARLDIEAPPSYTAPILRVDKGGTTAFVVHANGTVGIHTIAPNTRLEVRQGRIRISDNWDNVLKTRQNANTYDLIGTYMGWDSSTVFIAGYYAGNSSRAARRVYFGGHPEHTVVDLINRRVGIGTTAPRARLEVVGRIWQTGTGRSVFLGEEAGNNDDLSDNKNVFVGYQAGASNTTGAFNVGVGLKALNGANSGSDNMVVGAAGTSPGQWSATSSANTVLGAEALQENAGNEHTAIGHQAHQKGGGHRSVVIGNHAMPLMYASNYNDNVVIGKETFQLDFLSEGVLIGTEILSLFQTPTSPSSNTIIGHLAYQEGKEGGNVAIGYKALRDPLFYDGTHHVAIGSNSATGGPPSTTTSQYSTSIGYLAATHSNNSTGIGYDGYLGGGHNHITLGNTSVNWIGGQVNWSTASDARIKRNVREDVHGLDFILRLRPVTYQIDPEAIQMIVRGRIDTATWPGKDDIKAIRFSGFIAQEVFQAAQEVGYAFSGVVPPAHAQDLYSLRYSEFVVPLVKAAQEFRQQQLDAQRRLQRVRTRLEALNTPHSPQP